MISNFQTTEFQDNESIHFPHRTSNYGDWSGLRVELSTRKDIALQEDIDGVLIIVQHPVSGQTSRT
jgi:hypothetical protein